MSDASASPIAEAAGSSPADAAVWVQGVGYAYGEREAVRDATFDVAPGETFGLLGPNGSGKTTLFRILTTLLRPDRGEARIFGTDVAREPSRVRRRIGVVFQAPSLDAKLRVRENLMHQGHLHGLWGRTLRDRTAEMLDRFGLADRADDRVDTLSGGLRRRVELAKGLLHRPDLLLLDEPATGLDPRARRELCSQLGKLREVGVTVLLTTHLMEVADACDRLALMDQGRVVAIGSPEELRRGVGGDIVSFESRDPDALSRRISERFDVEAGVVNGTVRIEQQQGHELLTRVMEAFPGEIPSATLARPTLEDVFLARTGHGLSGESTGGAA